LGCWPACCCGWRRRWPLGVTVKAHVSRLLTKLDVANRVQIAIVVHDAKAS
jgi:hypothetical protein